MTKETRSRAGCSCFCVAIFEVCIAFTLQIVGQKYTPPALAAIIMSMESLFAALSGWMFLHESMTQREITGCIIMLTAFVVPRSSWTEARDEALDSELFRAIRGGDLLTDDHSGGCVLYEKRSQVEQLATELTER